MSYQKILVALDRTAASDRVYDHALSLAEPNQTQMQLIHCLSIKPYENLNVLIDAGVGLRSSSQVQREEEAAQRQHLQEAQAWLKQMCNETSKKGIMTTSKCEVGDPGILICRLAKEWEADVVVVGNGGKKGIKKLFLGSVSDYVAHHSLCLTIIVPNDGSPSVQFLPAVEGSSN